MKVRIYLDKSPGQQKADSKIIEEYDLAEHEVEQLKKDYQEYRIYGIPMYGSYNLSRQPSDVHMIVVDFCWVERIE